MTETTNGFKQHLDDLQSFPILTEEVEVPTTSRPATSGAAGTSALGDIVHNALRDVLGWRPKVNDPKSFVVALKQAFTPTEVEGRTTWTWTPRTYAIETDLGAITGAQASIYARAKAALEQSLPLLEGLQPLRSDADKEDLEASRAIVRSALKEIVDELGIKGGPRVARVDELFESLLGSNPDLPDPEQVSGQLGLLRDRFGMQRQFVNTVEEEQNLTNFLILVDSAASLRLTWESQKPFFTRTSPDVFFGTQQVLLGRALGVVAEAVHEAYFAMNSVFLGPAERETTILKLKNEAGEIFATLTVAELLDWVERFATDEGLRLIREGGKDGVIHAFVPTVEKLRDVVRAAAVIAQSNSDNPTQAFHTARVRRALNELQGHLETTFGLASQVKRLPAPEITIVRPVAGVQGQQVRLNVYGANFQDGARVRLVFSTNNADAFDAQDVAVVSATAIDATLDLSIVQAKEGTWDVVVINPDQNAVKKEKAFTIRRRATTPLQVTVVYPPESAPGKELTVMIAGSGFTQGASLVFSGGGGGEEIEVKSISILNGELLTAHISLPHNAQPGSRDVRVTVLGQTASKSEGFEVLPKPIPPPVITELEPNNGHPSETKSVTIRGTGFQDPVKLSFGGQDIRISGIKFVSSSEIEATIEILGGAFEGSRNVTVINPDTQLDTLVEGFRVMNRTPRAS